MCSFSYLEPVCCSMPSSNCCFLTCIQVSQEAGQVVWYSQLFLTIFLSMLPEEISICIGSLNKQSSPPQSGWVLSSLLKASIEQKCWGSLNPSSAWSGTSALSSDSSITGYLGFQTWTATCTIDSPGSWVFRFRMHHSTDSRGSLTCRQINPYVSYYFCFFGEPWIIQILVLLIQLKLW